MDLIRAWKQEDYHNFFAIYGNNAFEYLVTSLRDRDKWVRIAAVDALQD